VDANREFRVWQESLRRAIRQWGDHDHHAKYLLDGPHLASAHGWAQRRPTDLAPAERAFIDSSTTAAARRRRGRRYRYGAAALVTVLAVVAGLVAAHYGGIANARQRITVADNFAVDSDDATGTNLAYADLYALAAWQTHQTLQSRSSLLSREADPYLGSFAEPAQFTVAALAISPDGRLLAVAGTPNPEDVRRSSVQLWDIATRRQLAAFAVPGPVRTVTFSPDGTTLAATPATASGNLQLWSVGTHRELPDPVAEKGVITSIAYSPDGRLLAVGELIPPYSRHGRLLALADVPAVIDLWDLTTHRMVRWLGPLSGPVWSLDFSDDGRLLASGDDDHTARIWDTATGAQRAVLTGTAAPVEAVQFEPGGGRILATGGPDGTIRVWNAITGAPYLRVPTSGATTAFAFSPGEPYLYTDLDFNDVSRVDLFTGNEAGSPIRLQQPVTQMAVSPDGRILVLGGPQGSLAALDIEGRTFYDPDRSPLTAVAVDRWGHLAAAGAEDGNVELWDIRDPAGAVTLRAGQDVVSVAFSPDGWHLAVGDDNCHVTIWDFQNARRLVDLNNARRVAYLAAPGTTGGNRLLYLAFSRDGKTLATYCSTNASPGSAVAILWDTRTFKRLATYRPPGALFAGGMAYSPDGRTIALDTGIGSVVFWDTRLHRVTGRIFVGQGTHDTLAFSPDGRLLAITAANTVQLWNVARRVRVAVTSPNTSQFRDLGFSPDGSTLAGTSQDATVHIWQVPNLQLIDSLSPPTPPLATGSAPAEYNGLAYTPDGRTLVTASSDSTAEVWDLSPGDEVRNICDALHGPQLASQWRQLAPSPGPDPCPP
jgi:WD40 repeat protein